MKPTYSQGDNPWWFDREFTVPGSELDMNQLPIDPFQPVELDVTCRVWGHDTVLEIYRIEIIGGKLDGEHFYGGYGWLAKYIKP